MRKALFAGIIVYIFAALSSTCLKAENPVDPNTVSVGLKAIFNYSEDNKKEILDRLNGGTVTIVSGTISGTYAQIAADLASVLDDGDRLRILPIIGRGSVQSVADILYLHGVDAGIVRADTLDYLERKGIAANVKSQLSYITKLYLEEMHILAPQEIQTLADLNGKTVSIDLPNGGTFITAINVFEQLGVKPKFVYIEQRIAYEKLRKGEIQALVSVQGRPSKFFSQVQDPHLHLIPVDYDLRLKNFYIPSKLSSDDYPNLVLEGRPVNTIAVSSVLAAFNWKPNMPRYKKLELFVDALFSRIEDLQKPPFHPKWREVTLAAELPGWQRFAPAKAWLERHQYANVDQDIKVKFNQFIENKEQDGGAPKRTSPDERQRLFSEFLNWQKNRKSE